MTKNDALAALAAEIEAVKAGGRWCSETPPFDRWAATIRSTLAQSEDGKAVAWGRWAEGLPIGTRLMNYDGCPDVRAEQSDFYNVPLYTHPAKAGGDGVTPAAHWRVEGKADPFGTRYDCERATLAYGHLTDDEMANEVFMNPSTLTATGAKDRIRWLSRALTKSLAPSAVVPVEDAAPASGDDEWHRNHPRVVVKRDNRGLIESVETERGEVIANNPEYVLDDRATLATRDGVWVPGEPTEEMIEAVKERTTRDFYNWPDIYRAFIAAAPKGEVSG